MLNDWDFLRYRGDYQDEKNLRESYQVDHYSEGYQEHLLARAQVVEQQILSQGVRLDAGLSPRFSGLNEEIRKALEIELPVQCYCLPDQTIHAVAIWSEHTAGRVAVFALTAGALRQMSDPELKAIMGHEFGHLRYQHHRFDPLFSPDNKPPSHAALPPLGESLFLRWKVKTEITADRLALLACGNLAITARALLRAQYGVDEQDLGLQEGSLIEHSSSVFEPSSSYGRGLAACPSLPLRFKALALFSRSQKARDYGLPSTNAPVLDDSALEDGVDEKWYPFFGQLGGFAKVDSPYMIMPPSSEYTSPSASCPQQGPSGDVLRCSSSSRPRSSAGLRGRIPDPTGTRTRTSASATGVR